MQLNHTGNRKDVYYLGKLKTDNLFHSVLETKVVKAYGWAPCNRFDDVGSLRPDVELFLNNSKFNIELDTGEMKRNQVQGRWDNYAMANESVHVITPYQDRLCDLLRWSEAIEGLGHFALLDDVLSDPFGAIWAMVGDEFLYQIGC
ncbi:MAG: hypothetical protein KDA86_25525 [Planctomycetaceae bacterium]|nr:hypothetical protein [Planctomycetaceae bacterium]